MPGSSNTPRVRVARTKCLAALAVAVIAALSLPPTLASAAPHGCADASASATRLPLETARTAVQCLINEERTSRGLPALRTSSRLAHSAQRWVNELVATDAFGHGNIVARVHAAGVRFSLLGENLGTGQATPSQIVRAWMASTDHCRNLLSPRFSEFGAGISPHAVRGWATGPSTWAEDFALPLGHRSPSHDWGPADGCPYSRL